MATVVLTEDQQDFQIKKFLKFLRSKISKGFQKLLEKIQTGIFKDKRNIKNGFLDFRGKRCDTHKTMKKMTNYCFEKKSDIDFGEFIDTFDKVILSSRVSSLDYMNLVVACNTKLLKDLSKVHYYSYYPVLARQLEQVYPDRAKVII